MIRGGCQSGRASGYFNSMEDNLEFSRYSQFTKYLAAVVAYYAREHGLHFGYVLVSVRLDILSSTCTQLGYYARAFQGGKDQ
jgi:hypothetical protein